MSARFSIILLSEDASAAARSGLTTIVEKLFKRFEDDGLTPRVEMLPAPGNVRPIVIANRWRSAQAKDEPEKRELWRYLARVVSEQRSFVVFHYDGDTVWSKRHQAGSVEKFGEVRTKVAQALHAVGKTPLSPDEINRRLARLIECVPFYSVEAWTHQATEHGIALCKAKGCGSHIERFKEWAADRTKLDDVLKPKEATCLRDAHNEELGKHVPVWDVVDAKRSLAAFASNLRANGELEEALASRT